MGSIRIAAIAIIVAGALALAYGGFTYTDEDVAAKLGPLQITVAEKKRVNIPVWAGIAAIVAGGLMLAGAGRR